jgi:hypothetical protein
MKHEQIRCPVQMKEGKAEASLLSKQLKPSYKVGACPCEVDGSQKGVEEFDQVPYYPLINRRHESRRVARE